MLIEIKSRHDGRVIYSGEFEKEARKWGQLAVNIVRGLADAELAYLFAAKAAHPARKWGLKARDGA